MKHGRELQNLKGGKRREKEHLLMLKPLIVIVHYDYLCFNLFCQLARQKCAPAHSLDSDNYHRISVITPAFCGDICRAWVKCEPADLQTDQRVNCGPNLRTRSAVYPLVGPQVRIIYISLSSLLLTFITALNVAYLWSFTCHMGPHRLKVVIKSGDSFFIGRQFQN